MKQLLHKPFYLIAFLVIITSFSSTQLFAQAGTLDLTFGDSGVVRSQNKISFGRLAVQSNNNKIVVCGNYYDPNQELNYITVSRFKPNGAVDSTYGDNGKTQINFPGYNYWVGASDIALQQDNKVVVVGFVAKETEYYIYFEAVLLRFLTNGKPDSSFGNNGSITIPDSIEHYSFNKVLIQPDGKIVCGGSGSQSTSGTYNDFLLYRFNTNGTPDSTFGKNGISLIDFSHNVDFQSDFLLKASGKFIRIGYKYPDGVLELAETGKDGHLVNGFGDSGEIVMSDSAAIGGYGLVRQSSGRLLAICIDTNNKTRYLAFTSNGIIDSTFGTNGIFELPQSHLYIGSVCIQDDDKIIGAGSMGKVGTFCVYRLLPNGKFDGTFGDHGIFKLPSIPNASAVDVLILKNKKILVCSDQYDVGGLLLRLNNDTTFPPLAAGVEGTGTGN